MIGGWMHAYYFSYDFAYASEKTQFQLLHILHPELERKPTCSEVLSTDAWLIKTGFSFHLSPGWSETCNSERNIIICHLYIVWSRCVRVNENWWSIDVQSSGDHVVISEWNCWYVQADNTSRDSTLPNLAANKDEATSGRNTRRGVRQHLLAASSSTV